MKRTASQTFTSSHYNDGRDGRDMCVGLDAVCEGPAMYADCGASQHSHASSLSRTIGAITGTFTREKARRRLSSFSSATSGPSRRRGSIQSFIESLPSSSATRKQSIDHQRAPLQHQDSGIPSQYIPTINVAKSSAFYKRVRSMRSRPQNHEPPHLSFDPSSGGAAARQAAAAARELRSLRELENEQTRSFLNGQSHIYDRDGLLMDNESGIDMTCPSESVPADSVADKKMSMSFHCTFMLRHQ